MVMVDGSLGPRPSSSLALDPGLYSSPLLVTVYSIPIRNSNPAAVSEEAAGLRCNGQGRGLKASRVRAERGALKQPIEGPCEMKYAGPV